MSDLRKRMENAAHMNRRTWSIAPVAVDVPTQFDMNRPVVVNRPPHPSPSMARAATVPVPIMPRCTRARSIDTRSLSTFRPEVRPSTAHTVNTLVQEIVRRSALIAAITFRANTALITGCMADTDNMQVPVCIPIIRDTWRIPVTSLDPRIMGMQRLWDSIAMATDRNTHEDTTANNDRNAIKAVATADHTALSAH
ncbi:MAG: hypothetical protein U0892_19360 [Pirellulales bacterium]